MGSSRPEDLGSVGSQRQPDTASVCVRAPQCWLWVVELAGLLMEILLASLAPLCLLAAELDCSKLFFCS